METQKKPDLGKLRDALDDGRNDAARGLLADLHPAETALILESLPPEERPAVWELCDQEQEGEILAELNDEVRSRLAEDMGTEAVVAATEGLEIDDLADIVADLPDEMSDRVKESLSSEDREQLESVLSYPEDSAGGLMDPDTLSVRRDVTLEVVMRYLRLSGDLPDQTPSVFVVDRDDHYIGVLYLSRIVTHDPETLVRDVMDDGIAAIDANEPAVDVATLFQNLDLVSAPVVDEAGKLIGEITIDDVVDVIQEQADHDILSMAGLDEEDDMFAPVVTSAQRRAIWLGVNLATAFLAAAVVAIFRPALEQVVILAILMPVVASMGGIAGSQTLTLMIRGLALGRVQDSNARMLLRKEMAVGMLNGLAWAVVVAAVTIVLFNSSWQVGAIIGTALIISLIAAALAGFAIPLILSKLRIDPALAGTVVLTTITDIVGFATFLGLGTLFLT
ncbi:MAG: magnesium transporter [Gammaproteobacteria bacterium]